MKFSSAIVCAVLTAGSADAFTQKPTSAFLQSNIAASSAFVPRSSSYHSPSKNCICTSCRSGSTSRTMVFSVESETSATTASTTTTTEVDVPAEVEALDGINSDAEAHNAERPARKSLKKKGPKGIPLSEVKVGSTVKARVKSLTSYGAFMDIGAETDGLLHISRLSVDYVADVKDVLQMDQEYDVRIIAVDENKKQVSLTLLTEAQEVQAAEIAQQRPAKRGQQQQQQQSNKRADDGPVLAALQGKGWDPDQFVEGKVVSTVDFGAFVRIDCSQLNSEVEGSVDGLVHISSLAPGRVGSVTDIVKVDDTVQVRVKAIEGGRKVSLSMISSEEESAPRGSGGGGSSGDSPVGEGNKDWKEALDAKQKDMPVFKNGPVVINNRA